MPDSVTTLIFIIVATAFSIIWGRLSLYFHENPKLSTRLVFYLMSFSKMTSPEIKSIILGMNYILFGIIGGLLFTGIYNLSVSNMIGFDIQYVSLILMGIIAEISLTNFFVSIYMRFSQDKKVKPAVEIQNIPWVSGIAKSPKLLVPFAMAISGFIEEFFFRGILLLILVEKLLVPPWIALMLVAILFLLEQLMQLKSSIQMAVIGCGCIAISLVGGVLVLYTHSIIPAGLCHASFVIFYLGYSDIIPGIRRRADLHP